MTMQTLAELEAKQAAERARLMAETALAEAAPVMPLRTQLTTGGLAPWLSYEAASLADALAIMAAAPIVPAYAYKSTFTRIQPESLADEKSGKVVAGPFAASIKVDQGAGYGPTAELRFFVIAGDQICEAHVTIGQRYRSPTAWRMGARFQQDARGQSSQGEGREYRRGDWHANTALAAMSDHLIKWGTGGEGASFQYFWMADTVEGGDRHAAEQIGNLFAGEGR